jgi:hypothetical protein
MLQTSLHKPVAWNNRYTMSPQSYFNLKCYTSFAFLPSDCPVMREGFPFNDHLPNEDTTSPRKVPQLIILTTPLSNPSTTFFLSLFLSCVAAFFLSHSFFVSLSVSFNLPFFVPVFSSLLLNPFLFFFNFLVPFFFHITAKCEALAFFFSPFISCFSFI